MLEGCKDVEGNLHKLGESYIGEQFCITIRNHSKHSFRRGWFEFDQNSSNFFLSFSGEDGCNTCQCTDGGISSCTKYLMKTQWICDDDDDTNDVDATIPMMMMMMMTIIMMIFRWTSIISLLQTYLFRRLPLLSPSSQYRHMAKTLQTSFFRS